jgi:PAS domain S-box-containing protein
MIGNRSTVLRKWSRRRQWSLAHGLVVFAILIGGIALSISLWRTLDWWEGRAFQAELNAKAQSRAKLLDASLERSMDALRSIAAFIAEGGSNQASPAGGVTREQFRRFVAGPLARQPELQALGWSPRVASADRGRYESEGRSAGLARFHFWEFGSNGDVIPSAVRSEHFAIQFLEPHDRNAPALGYDLASDPLRAACLHIAAKSGRPAATPPLRLVQESEKQLGFLVVLPVYRDVENGSSQATGATSPPAAEKLIGYASAVYRIGDLVQRAAAGTIEEGLDFTLTDNSDGGRALFHQPARQAPVAGLAGTASLSLAGRSWSVVLRPDRTFVDTDRRSESNVVLTGGIALTLLLTAYLSAGLRRRALIERRVTDRTRQLRGEVHDRRRAETAARVAERAARTAEARYRGIFENAVEGIFQTTPDGHYLSANPALARIYGYESIDRLIADLTNIAGQLYVDAGRREEFVRLVQRDGVVVDFESRIFRKDGLIIWISENARVIRDELGQAAYYEGTVVDVTSRRRAEELLRSDRDLLEARVNERTTELQRAAKLLRVEVVERQRAQEQAAAASAAKTLFLANVSHEIRTPMNVILGYAQLLGRATNLTSEQREAMSTVLSSGRHLLDLIDDVLDLSKVEAGRAELNPAPFSPVALARELATLFAARCGQKDLSLCLNIDSSNGELPESVQGDERKLRQVLINLVGNAIKFTDAGEIRLSVSRSESIEHGLRFEVSDTGIGIAPEGMEVIFEPFQQTAAGAGRGGTGLGLAIARGCIELMGGRLKVDSSPGRGARFHFEIALPALADAGKPVARRCVLGGSRRPRVLVVDDSVDGRRVLADLLVAIGCDVDIAADAKQALACIARSRPDLAVVDIVMPGIDGPGLARLIAAETDGPPIRLVASSASAMRHEQEQYQREGFEAFLPKPIELGKLAETIAGLLDLPLVEEALPTASSAGGFEPTEGQESLEPADALWGGGGADEELPAPLRRRIVIAARRSSATDLRQCLREVERLAPGSAAAAVLRRGLRTYDMDLIDAEISADNACTS